MVSQLILQEFGGNLQNPPPLKALEAITMLSQQFLSKPVQPRRFNVGETVTHVETGEGFKVTRIEEVFYYNASILYVVKNATTRTALIPQEIAECHYCELKPFTQGKLL